MLNGWHFTATASEPSMWVIPFHHGLPHQVLRQVQTAGEKGPLQIPTTSDNDEGTDVDEYLNTAMFLTQPVMNC
jgi:hypothetical protein